jgi:Na+/proline symporter
MIEAYRHPIILLFIGLYMLLCVWIGFWSMRRTKSVGDFFMASRKLGVVVTAVAMFSSLISGFAFVGGPGLVYRIGLGSVGMGAMGVMGGCIVAVLVAKRMRLIGELRDTMSLADAIAARYRSETARFLTGVAVLLGVLGYLATQIVAMSIVLKTLMAEAGMFGEVPLEVYMTISCAVLVFYCATGGVIAGVYTDLFQGFVMIAAAVLVFLTARAAFDGGFTEANRVLVADDPETIGPWGSVGLLACLSWMFLFSIGVAGQPHVITKYMMFKNIGDLRRIVLLTMIMGLFTSPLVLGIGLAMRSLVLTGVQTPLEEPDTAAPVFLLLHTHPVLAGIVFAALFAAIMSTADSFLNIGVAAVVHDIPRALTGRAIPRELTAARAATVVIALAAAVFGLYARDLVALLGAFGYATFAAAIVPAVVIGFNWKRANALAVNVTIVFSLAVNFGLKLFGVVLPWGIDGGAASLFGAILLFLLISMATRPQPIDPDIEAVMDM